MTGSIAHQTGKPFQKVYSITDAGRTAFVDALFEPLSEDVYRNPFFCSRFASLARKPRPHPDQGRLAEWSEIAELRTIEKHGERNRAASASGHTNDAGWSATGSPFWNLHKIISETT